MAAERLFLDFVETNMYARLARAYTSRYLPERKNKVKEYGLEKEHFCKTFANFLTDVLRFWQDFLALAQTLSFRE